MKRLAFDRLLSPNRAKKQFEDTILYVMMEATGCSRKEAVRRRKVFLKELWDKRSTIDFQI